MGKQRPTYSLEFRQAAVEQVLKGSKAADVATTLGISVRNLRRWVNQVEIDRGKRIGISSQEQVELRRLQRENQRLKEEVEILRLATDFFERAQH